MTEINITRRQNTVDISDDIQGYHLPIASATQLGGIKVGDNLTIEEDGTLNANEGSYTLPVASSDTLGGIKVGNNLNINDGVLSVATDSILSTTSSKPIQNATVAQTINTISNSLDGIENDIDAIEDDIEDIDTAIGAVQSDVTELDTALDSLDGTVSNLSTAVSGYSASITQNTDDITALNGRMTTAEDDIDNLESATNEMSSDITDLKYELNTTISYTELLPVSSWTYGDMILRRRGKIAYLFLNIEGSMVIGANTSTIIYTFSDPTNIPTYGTFAPIYTNTGDVIMSINDQGEVALMNLSASPVTITKIYGTLPVMY